MDMTPITGITIRDVFSSWVYSDVTLYPECTLGELYEAVNTALGQPGRLNAVRCLLMLSDRRTLVADPKALLGEQAIRSGDTLYIVGRN